MINHSMLHSKKLPHPLFQAKPITERFRRSTGRFQNTSIRIKLERFGRTWPRRRSFTEIPSVIAICADSNLGSYSANRCCSTTSTTGELSQALSSTATSITMFSNSWRPTRRSTVSFWVCTNTWRLSLPSGTAPRSSWRLILSISPRITRWDFWVTMAETPTTTVTWYVRLFQFSCLVLTPD